MITIFSIPKPFTGSTGMIQRNAIGSWRALGDDVEILLYGNETGVSNAAADYRAVHYPDIKTNEHGTPLVSAAFRSAHGNARRSILMYANADIILLPDLVRALKRLAQGRFFCVGRRWDLDVGRDIPFEDSAWPDRMRRLITSSGRLHGYSGIDYMIFPRDLRIDMPDFAVGRQGWDNWVLWRVKRMGVPIYDCTDAITVVHQNHDYAHSRYGQKERVGGPETRKNYRLAGGFSQMLSIRESDWLFTRTGLRRLPFRRQLHSFLSRYEWWQYILSLKRRINSL
ncbi:MAG TPA: hypothetical protein PKL03_05200 [Candidatus Omnitrophota bacterium]|nr:hypothetical protein [Candidatus Omnitrophota bacterium]HNQ50815.1 hypothetical protein [Candidatus Omnitrophota bacterium]